MAESCLPKRGERWKREGFPPQCSVCRVMSDPIEGWVVCRFKRFAPFIQHVNEFVKHFHKIDTQGGGE